LESSNERPEDAPLRELESVLRAVGEEMVALRRRAQVAEARIRELERGEQLALDAMSSGSAPADVRVSELEQENDALKDRLDTARDRAAQLADRLKFLRQQYADPQG
jgi:predicted  nucleic acid-binding Zn-ribbon protein